MAVHFLSGSNGIDISFVQDHSIPDRRLAGRTRNAPHQIPGWFETHGISPFIPAYQGNDEF
jgi:hypothetical protein